MKPRITQTPIEGVVIVDVDCFNDERGFFMESWSERDFRQAGLDATFVQDNHSRSRSGVLRGLHYQDMRAPIAKLVRCTHGRIFDVAVDLRTRSATFGRWFGLELSAGNRKQLYAPVGCAHGFLTLSEFAEVQYKQTGYYDPNAEGAIRWDDPDVGIAWPLHAPILSKKDRNAPTLTEYLKAPAFL